jgi:hypothetical protein
MWAGKLLFVSAAYANNIEYPANTVAFGVALDFLQGDYVCASYCIGDSG